MEQDKYMCNVVPERQLHNLFAEPTYSKSFDICVVDNINKNIAMNRKVVTQAEIKRKVIYFAYHQGFVLIPLIHDVCWK